MRGHEVRQCDSHLCGLKIHIIISNLEVDADEVDKWDVVPKHT
jgi:hypothetical protein